MSIPPREVRRWQPPPPSRRPARRQIRWWELPGLWWRRHAWVPVWLTVFLTPAALLSLRVLDDIGIVHLIPAMLLTLCGLFVIMLGVAVVTSASRSKARALAGGASAVAAAVLLVLPMIHVIGQRACPPWMGEDRGVDASLQMLEAWRRGEPAPNELWTNGSIADLWKPRAATAALLDYKLVATGCWERLAPVPAKLTWHEFRVTVQKEGADAFSKTLTVHTVATGDGWRISEVDGPDPS